MAVTQDADFTVPKAGLKLSHRSILCALVATVLAGCSGTSLELPPIAPPNTATALGSGSAKAGAGAQAPTPSAVTPIISPVSPSDTETIVGFRGKTVVLYRDESGHDGEKTTAGTLSLPMTARKSSGNSSRLEVSTASGPRWVARGEVLLAKAAAAATPPVAAPPR